MRDLIAFMLAVVGGLYLLQGSLVAALIFGLVAVGVHRFT